MIPSRPWPREQGGEGAAGRSGLPEAQATRLLASACVAGLAA